MDPLAAADRLLAAIGTDALRDLLDEAVHFRGDAVGVLRRDDAVALMVERTRHGRFAPGERAMKRNLVFVWFGFKDIDGKPIVRGTWILSFDREGQVIEWQEFQG